MRPDKQRVLRISEVIEKVGIIHVWMHKDDLYIIKEYGTVRVSATSPIGPHEFQVSPLYDFAQVLAYFRELESEKP